MTLFNLVSEGGSANMVVSAWKVLESEQYVVFPFNSQLRCGLLPLHVHYLEHNFMRACTASPVAEPLINRLLN